ncbi:hypothetical protein bcgnr5369_08580 [Bacillus cereus]|uniref:Uncharacterized protein n=1 Tax=Bacillus thuringiensis TaxID=1428 RepID=A0A9X6ZQ68_BACTU|nr:MULTISPECIES: hypothetical protein [Bacillus cereus group]PFJ29037.1 hypothetical protein COJ15_32760 [Bacillus thuringiensis]PGP14644.1 hypothetical protein COA01_30290 [Bacillus cereus]
MDKEQKRMQMFNFKGMELNYWMLKDFTTLKTYVNTSHDTRSLVQDDKGNLYLYVFHEEMSFSGPDVMTEFFFLVKNEEEAGEKATESAFSLRSEFDYIHIPYDWDISVREHTTK